MDEYRLYWVAGVWTVLESFEPETSEKVLLDRWLTQQQRNLTPAKVRQPEGCRNAKKVRQAAWTAGRQAEIYPAMDYRSEEHSLQEVSNG